MKIKKVDQSGAWRPSAVALRHRYSVTALQCREDTPHPRKNKLYYIFIYIYINI